VQTAGHVSGAVRFFQQQPSSTGGGDCAKLFPVCLHPRFGGWFALRGVIILPGAEAPDLERLEPPEFPDLLLEEGGGVENLLELYNHHWRDWRWRDVVPVEERYSDLQKRYFETRPGDRLELIKSLAKT